VECSACDTAWQVPHYAAESSGDGRRPRLVLIGSTVLTWTTGHPWEKVDLWVIFVALGVLIAWLTFAFWGGSSNTAVLLRP
jgi:hypothetical protein